MTPAPRAVRLAAAAALLAAAQGCAGARIRALAPPRGPVALGLAFGADRAATEGALRAAGIPFRAAPGDPDALVAERCPEAPAAAPCRLLFGPKGLYAAQLELSPGDERALVHAVRDGLGAPARLGDAAAPGAGRPALVAAWSPSRWTVGVSRVAAREDGGAAALLRLEYDPATPPVVQGVPLGRLRSDVEHLLDREGATVVQRDAGATTYLGCPQGAAEAVSCLVLFRDGRAAAVTEVHPAPPDDAGALAAWRALASRWESEIGRAPETTCPPEGPDRVGGDCTATWSSERLGVVVGAHRNAGSRHRGAISVYTAFTYPPLARTAEDAEPAAP